MSFELKMATFSVQREVRPDGGWRISSEELPGLILSSSDNDYRHIAESIKSSAKWLAEHGGLSVEGVFSTDKPDRYVLMYRQPVHFAGRDTP